MTTYSNSLRIILPGYNQQAGVWGTSLNTDFGTLFEQAICGSNTISLTNVSSYTLSTGNGVVDQARYAVLVFNGAPTGNCNVIAPSVQKLYIIGNQTNANTTITIKTSGGNGINISYGNNQLVYCDGTNFYTGVGVQNVYGNLSVSDNITYNANLYATSNSVNLSQNTGAFLAAAGTTAQRPTPVLGMSRWNTTLGWYEIWNGTIWQQITGSFTANYLVVGGGGAGSGQSAGGGAGGFLTGSLTLIPLNSFAITVGSGGTYSGGIPTAGSNSSISGIATAIGGGSGNGVGSFPISGGSSGGGSAAVGYEYAGTPTSGQGYTGGSGISYTLAAGGGGGGAGAVGTQAVYDYVLSRGAGIGGNGGSGIASSITGTSTYYAGGGAAGGNVGIGSPGAGGGGSAWTNYFGAGNATAGTANTGGGGGGAYGADAGGGGSGVVIISYISIGSARATGGTITTYSSGGNTYYVHTFTSSGTFTTIQELNMPSTYSTDLRLELIGNGEQTGTWGTTTNNNLGTLVEQAIAGVASISIAGLTSYTLTALNGASDQARNAVLVLTGALTANCNVSAPSVQKLYIVSNQTTGGYNVNIKTSGGTAVTVLNGTNQFVYCDATNFYTAVNVNSVNGNLTVTGTITLGGNLNSSTNVINMSVNTGALIPPTGTAAQRPATLQVGMSRWNTDTGVYEIWTGSSWQIIAAGTYTISYLIAGGGGAGGSYGGGGGGAGGYLTGSTNLTPLSTYTITVGSGGTSGGSGGNSSISSIGTSVGGGAGGGQQTSGSAGGSGGGGGCAYGSGSALPGGAGTSGQGNTGGYGTFYADGTNIYLYGGGGGGAGAVGGAASYSAGGTGGAGNASSITGSSVTYAAGGTGANYADGGGSSGTANTGNGGNGGGSSGGGNGGSGVVILSIPTASYTGVTTGTPTVTTNGANTILKYTGSGTYKA